MKTVLLVLALQVSASDATATRSGCPPSIVVDESLAATPAGWRADTRQGKRPLDGATVYNGPISGMQALVAEPVVEDGRRTSHYPFGAAQQDDVWIRCTYASSSVTLEGNMGRPEECTAVGRDDRNPRFDFTCTYK